MSEEVSDGYYIRRREFLNEDLDLPAYIIGIVEDTRAIPDDDPERWNNGEITLDLSDCQRRISFYFDMRNQHERANSLRKISLIAEIVNAVREAIALEVESRNARPEKTTSLTEDTQPDQPPDVVKVMTVQTEERPIEQVFKSHFVTLGL